jgi:Domain of unknown function (DUF4347)
MNTLATANLLVSAGAAFTSAVKTLSSLVVFDSRLSDLDVLYGALLPSAIGHTIDVTEDALVVITGLLAETGAKSLAIVAHGEPGIIHCTNTLVETMHFQCKALAATHRPC